MFNQRVLKPEILDHVSPEEARPNLADLVRINRDFGGHSVLRKTLSKITDTAEVFSVLDVGAASGDSAQVIRGLYPNARITSLDYNQVNLEKAASPQTHCECLRTSLRPRQFRLRPKLAFPSSLHQFRGSRAFAPVPSHCPQSRDCLRSRTACHSIPVFGSHKTPVWMESDYRARWPDLRPRLIPKKGTRQARYRSGNRKDRAGSVPAGFPFSDDRAEVDAGGHSEEIPTGRGGQEAHACLGTELITDF